MLAPATPPLTPSPPSPTAPPAPVFTAPRFAALGADFFTPLAPQGVPHPYWVARNPRLARELGLDTPWLDSEGALAALSGNAPLCGAGVPGGPALASVYSGHQFGVWAGQLGDGRAHLLGDVRAPDGQAHEVQIKGAGLTPYSRMGDGRAVLRSSVREFLASEAMHALGVPTTRALALIGSDLPVYREQAETAAVVTRVAPSFIRFGHFEHFAARGDTAALRRLADFVIDHFYPEVRESRDFGGQADAALLHAIGQRTATLLAHWQALGFCHGVMNTDNMSVLGLTLDYGPYRFMDGFEPGLICNHSDSRGRYAFDRQSGVAYWNLLCLARALLPLIGDEALARAAIEPFEDAFAHALTERLGAKLGLPPALAHSDARVRPLLGDLLTLLAAERIDHTIFWRRLSHHVARAAGCPRAPQHPAPGAAATTGAVTALFADRAGIDAWMLRYQELLKAHALGPAADLMLNTNPALVLRNHLAEDAIEAARQHQQAHLQRLLAALQEPFDPALEQRPDAAPWLDFAPAWASDIRISCSS